MTLTVTNYNTMEGITAVVVLFSVVTTVLWLVIAWRAMRAHERIADAASEWIQLHRPPPVPRPSFPPPRPPGGQPPQ